MPTKSFNDASIEKIKKSKCRMEHETNKSGDCCCCAARIFIVNKKVDSTEPNSKGENEIKKKTNMVSTVISKLGS